MNNVDRGALEVIASALVAECPKVVFGSKLLADIALAADLCLALGRSRHTQTQLAATSALERFDSCAGIDGVR